MILNKNKNYCKDKIDFDSITLKIYQNRRYELTLNSFPKEFNNLYLWNYIQRDIIYAINEDYFINIEISDKKYSEIFRCYLSGLYNFIDIDENRLLICCKKSDYRISTELIEGSDILQYTNIIKILFFPNLFNSSGTNYYNDKLNEIAVKMEPCGDNLGFYIYINDEYIAEETLIAKIKNVLEKYKMHLNITL